jgi:hypothetical protein
LRCVGRVGNDSAAGGFIIYNIRTPLKIPDQVEGKRAGAGWDKLFLFLGFLLCCFFLAGATATCIAHFRILPFLIFESKIRQQGKSMYIKYNNRLKRNKKTKK